MQISSSFFFTLVGSMKDDSSNKTKTACPKLQKRGINKADASLTYGQLFIATTVMYTVQVAHCMVDQITNQLGNV